MSGNVKLAMSHVVPDLVQKVLKGQDPLHILGSGKPDSPLHVRRRSGQGHPHVHRASRGQEQDFNLSTPVRTTVLELAEAIWNKIHGGKKPFRYVSDPPFEYDVQERSPM